MAISSKQSPDAQRRRQRPCKLCVDKTPSVDYKDTFVLKRFLSEQGKIVSRRVSGNCAVHQREVTLAIKRSREIGLCGVS